MKNRRLALNEYIGRVVSSLSGFSNNITPETSYDSVKTPIKTVIPIGIAINELLTNAIKYAFPGGRSGTIKLSMKKTNAGAVIIVEDNGIGLPECFDLSTLDSLGLNLCSSLIKQLKGRFNIEEKDGTRCIVEFPIHRE
ncbi:MAG: sensor histidine kinase [bacterium]|nr:sensor histidine kinase [bacterium]